MDEKSKAVYQRGQIKAQVTRFVTYINNLTKSNIDSNAIYQTQYRLNKVEPLLDEFYNIQRDIDVLNEGVVQDDEREAFETAFFDVVAVAKQLIDKQGVQANKNNPSSGSDGISGIKLPDINLPSFDGNYTNFLEFYNTFKALIHDNPKIGAIQKFHYLKNALTKDAKQVIEALEATESNYSIAWDMLRERYENKRLIVFNHVKALYNLNTVVKESSNSLRQLIDTVQRHLRSLKALGQCTEYWDILIIHLISVKLDHNSRREWESHKINGDLPTFEELMVFLKHKCQVLETLDFSKIENKPFIPKVKTPYFQTRSLVVNAGTSSNYCTYCDKEHSIYYCEAFQGLSINSRIAEAKMRNLCMNCLRKGHLARFCRTARCKKCNKAHNTLLHLQSEPIASSSNSNNAYNNSVISATDQPSNSTVAQTVQVNNPSGAQSTVTYHSLSCTNQVLLSTVCVFVEDIHGNRHICRILLDSGSQSNFASQELCNLLGIKKYKINASVTGINQNVTNILYEARVNLYSCNDNYNVTVSCFILPKITEASPVNSFDRSLLNIPSNIQLADPCFNKSGKIDMLLGASVFWDLLCDGQIRLGKSLPVLHNTKFGWIISGNMNCLQAQGQSSMSYFCAENNIENQISKFWEIEEGFNNSKPCYSKEELECESLFQKTTKRNLDERFIVSMPLKGSICELGDSRNNALNRFYSLEKRLNKNPSLKLDYGTFMEEYIQLGHMSELRETSANEIAYYLPHHAVVKESSITSKTRVVFDGSAKSTSGVSLNDIQMVGPTIQNDLFSIMLRFRKHPFVITADIAKMYRQILVNPAARDLQRIFWRKNTDEELKCFQLNTVTYGQAAAPFLAVRCLYQLALEYSQNFPQACHAIKSDFYIDDLLSGADTIQDAIKLKEEVEFILQSAGFQLRKWLSNNKEILQGLSNMDTNSSSIYICEKPETKTLGILWNSEFDIFQYSASDFKQNLQITKRVVLSTTARIFDALGILSPIIIVAKVFIQKLWQIKLGWDEAIPSNLKTEWYEFCENLPSINEIKIPRNVICPNAVEIQLHGFSDSSERSYGACIYLRSVDHTGNCVIKLLCAKSKVAPLKTISLPRLELCGALLLSNLSKKVIDSMEIKFNKCFYWCDSTITLSWIRATPQKWKTFVANRVAEIQNLTNIEDWRHVRSHENPADIVSRGSTASQLLKSNLWWNGPSWLLKSEEEWPTESVPNNYDLCELPEFRNVVAGLTVTVTDLSLFNRYSSYFRLKRIVAYCLRFRFNATNIVSERKIGPLSISEIELAHIKLIKMAQEEVFNEEILNITKGKSIDNKSSILSLNPFLDSNGLLRVGGRLTYSNYDTDKKHPIIMPSNHPLSKLIVNSEHVRLMHCGPQALLASIRDQYWPISGRNLVKRVVHECVTCFKAKPSNNITCIMGALPKTRISPALPFETCGVDYAGPIFIRDRMTRNYKPIKCYICLFVCFVTKAIHLELVSDATTQAFLATFRRFTARRGKPKTIYSDNGTNFVGANLELKELCNFLTNSKNQRCLSDAASKDGVEWRFIPPRSPHWGGLWESGIKATKSHLRRIMGNACLTYEDLNTLLTQIEAVLNSRPLYPMSSDPNDCTPLTPGHFLIGRPLTALPDPDVIHLRENRLSTYQRLQQLLQHFWRRWSGEYIANLQTRAKWKQTSPQLLTVGSLVVIREDNQPPLRWQLGRVAELHPGADGCVRVVSVKVANQTIIKRSVTKLCALPLDVN